MEKYTTVGRHMKDTVDVYSPQSLDNDIVFEGASSTIDTIRDADNYIKGLVRNGKYWLYNQIFANKLLYRLKLRYSMVRVPREIVEITMKKIREDGNGQLIFTSIRDFTEWMKIQSRYSSYVRKLSEEDLLSKTPIPYNPSNNIYYILQPLETFYQALTVAIIWNTRKYNIGQKESRNIESDCDSNINPDTLENIQVKIYNIMLDGDLRLVRILNEEVDMRAYELIKHDDKWVAMLPLLYITS